MKFFFIIIAVLINFWYTAPVVLSTNLLNMPNIISVLISCLHMLQGSCGKVLYEKLFLIYLTILYYEYLIMFRHLHKFNYFGMRNLS